MKLHQQLGLSALLFTWGTVAAADPLFQFIQAPEAALTADQQQKLGDLRSRTEAHLVRINAALFKNDQTITLNLPDTRIDLKAKSRRSTRDSVYWYGVAAQQASDLQAQEILETSFVVRDNMISGSLIKGKDRYTIQPVSPGVSMLILQKKKIPDHVPGANLVPGRDPQIDRFDPGWEEGDFRNTVNASIRVLVAYTPAVAAAHADVRGLIDLAVQETNQSYQNSGVRASLELAGVTAVNYKESGSHDLDLQRFRVPGDGFMDEIAFLRENYEADIAVIIVDDASACGLASEIGATTRGAYALVHWECATGYYSFAHEIGHLLGARHNLQADPTQAPYTYGHGYYPANQSYRTVMSYDCPNTCSRVPYWSNPAVVYNGLVAGTAADADNARVLNSTMAGVARFYNERCVELRDAALRNGKVSKEELEIYAEGGLAPIFSDPSNFNSSIETWAACSVVKGL